MTRNEQKKLLKKISTDLCGIFDGIYGEFDDEMNECIEDVERNINSLLRSFDEDNEEKDVNPVEYDSYYEYEIPNEFGENEQRRRECNNADALMCSVSQTIAFSDCSDERVTKIVYKGVEVHYTGWQSGNVMEYADANGNIVWSGCFPQWDH